MKKLGLVFGLVCLFASACGGSIVTTGDSDPDGNGGEAGAAGGPGTGGSAGAPTNVGGEGGSSDLPDFTVWRDDQVPNGSALVSGGTLNMVMQLRFTAETDTVIESIVLKDVGVGSFEDLGIVYLYNGYPDQGYIEGVVDTATGLIAFPDLDLLVSPGEEQYYSLYVQYDAPAGAAGSTHRFSLESAAMFNLSDEREIIGDFPIESATQTLVSPPSATYCDPWNPTSEYGYQGCCGTFSELDDIMAIQPGMLFKGGLEMVYYMGSDGKRYVFPTTMILDSWYGPYDADGIPLSDGSVCNSVYQLPDAEVASVPIGGNVTFRPGVFVTGIMTDPARYVVSKGGVLRKLVPPSLQDQIYPGTAALRLRRSPDAFFVNFLMGAVLTDSSEYDPVVEFATTLEQNLGLAP